MKRRTHRRNSKGGGKVLFILLLIALLGLAAYIYTAKEFERIPPQIKAPELLYWNRADPLKIELRDDTALRSYKLTLNDGNKSIIVGQGRFPKDTKKQILTLKYPQSKDFNSKANELQLNIEATDSSMWNFLSGNHAEKNVKIIVDSKRPNVNILANSYSITQGGSALVVFQAEDANMKDIYIDSDGRRFEVTPYKKDGYYAALIAWPFNTKSFSAKIIATDKANNKRVSDIPFYLKNHNYRVSWIKARDKFIDGKITELASGDPEYAGIKDKFEKLVAVNETMRLKNEALIHKLSKNVPSKMVNKWKIGKFYPLKNGARVASFGDERHYYYKNKSHEVSHSYHVGYDLASTKMAPIVSSNKGKVIFANENGIYGNMPLIDHGMGLHTLYGHCSQILVKEGDEVKVGQTIARTGKTGLALGDHLHFGVLVQGVEVRPVEWFDGKWIRTNIDDVFKEANKIIDGK